MMWASSKIGKGFVGCFTSFADLDLFVFFLVGLRRKTEC